MIHQDKLLWIWTIILLGFCTTVSITSKVFWLFKLTVISYFINHELFQHAKKNQKLFFKGLLNCEDKRFYGYCDRTELSYCYKNILFNTTIEALKEIEQSISSFSDICRCNGKHNSFCILQLLTTK